MEIITTTDATAFVTAVTGGITDNLAGVLQVLGFAAAVGIGFGLLRYALAKVTHAWRG